MIAAEMARAANHRITDPMLMSVPSCSLSTPFSWVPCGVVWSGACVCMNSRSAMVRHLLPPARDTRIVERRHRTVLHLPCPAGEPDPTDQQRSAHVRPTDAEVVDERRLDPPPEVDKAHQH